MEIFEKTADKNCNLLPEGGTVHYFGRVMTLLEADEHLQLLLANIEWKNDQAVIFGRHILTKRKVAWYGDKEFSYTYSNITKQAFVWTKELLNLKKLVEELTSETYNSCLLNLYHSGEEGMAYHSDGEKDLKKNGAIASLTLGAERKFSFKHKTTKEKISIVLEHGSLLVMKGETQQNWLHRLPPTKLISTARINLTFRTIM